MLADPGSVPADQIADAIGELEKAKAVLWARLTAPVPAATNDRPPHDVIDDVREVARIARRSVSWVRKRGHTLPGFHQPGGRGTKVGWTRGALEAWATGPTP